MTTYDKYCPGENCQKRDECAMHQWSNICTNFPSLRDWSQERCGECWCGDMGNYDLFIPKETTSPTNKQIAEDFLHFLSTHKGVVTTENYSYAYSELRNALIEYHKETAAAGNYAYAVIPDDEQQISVISKEQMEEFKDELKQYNKSRCRKCVYEMRCSRDKDYEGKCPDYKRDAPDGGYYG